MIRATSDCEYVGIKVFASDLGLVHDPIVTSAAVEGTATVRLCRPGERVPEFAETGIVRK